jgi:hypothetical protein
MVRSCLCHGKFFELNALDPYELVENNEINLVVLDGLLQRAEVIEK